MRGRSTLELRWFFRLAGYKAGIAVGVTMNHNMSIYVTKP